MHAPIFTFFCVFCVSFVAAARVRFFRLFLFLYGQSSSVLTKLLALVDAFLTEEGIRHEWAGTPPANGILEARATIPPLPPSSALPLLLLLLLLLFQVRRVKAARLHRPPALTMKASALGFTVI